MNFGIVIFLILLSAFLYLRRKNVKIQKILFPVFYMVLYPTKIGLKLMESWGTKYRETIKFIGYCSIGIAVVGLIYAVVNLLASLYIVFKAPQPVISLILPGSNIPGLGKISFSHWIISIFVIAVIHEFSHGVMAVANKIKVNSSGFGFFSFIVPILPAFFVEPDEKSLRKKEDVSQYSIFAAGPVSNILTYVILMLIIAFAMSPLLAVLASPNGVSLQSINQSYPSYQYFNERTVITSVNNKTIFDLNEFSAEMAGVKPNQTVILANSEKTFKLAAVSAPENKSRGFIGVTNFKTEYKFSNEMFGKAFLWTYNLLMFVAVLSLLIGLVNLLPLGPIDGGRIAQLFFSKVTKTKEKAKKWWLIVSFATVAVLVALAILPPILTWI
jgi:membrane-associated protease RseP (regulator of RpoE activity)